MSVSVAQRKKDIIHAHWVPDQESGECMECHKPFHWLFRRRHHCRECGRLVCGSCSPNKGKVYLKGNPNFPVEARLCNRCNRSELINVDACSYMGLRRTEAENKLRARKGAYAMKIGLRVTLRNISTTGNHFDDHNPKHATITNDDSSKKRRIPDCRLSQTAAAAVASGHSDPRECSSDCPICQFPLNEESLGWNPNSDPINLHCFSKSGYHLADQYNSAPASLKGADTLVTINRCGHTCHASCLINWMRTKPHCPLCRCSIHDE